MLKNSRNVVVIDDDEVTVYFALREIEKSLFFDGIYSFTNPREALVFFRNLNPAESPILEKSNINRKINKIDLLLLDFRMPYLNGVEFLEALRADHLDHLVEKVAVMLTIPLMPDDEDRFRAASPNVVFLDKPLDGDALAGILPS